jgi:hypothetical protein
VANFGRFSPKRKQLPEDNGTRFGSASDATKELHEQFNDWSAAIPKYGQQVALALIAANWAIYGSRAAILSNPFSKWSIAVAVLYLGVNLAGVSWMTRQFSKRKLYADEDVARWKREYEASIGVETNWPYTAYIDGFGGFMRCVHTFAPLASGALLLISLFWPAPPQPKPLPPAPPTPCTPDAIAGPQHIASINGFLPGSALETDDGGVNLRSEVTRAADTWISKRNTGQHGLLLIVGSTDRVGLGSSGKARFDANIGLAQARAQEVKTQLMSVVAEKGSQALPTADELLVLASGPAHSPAICPGCSPTQGYPEDRRVDIWAIWSSRSGANACPPGAK